MTCRHEATYHCRKAKQLPTMPGQTIEYEAEFKKSFYDLDLELKEHLKKEDIAIGIICSCADERELNSPK